MRDVYWGEDQDDCPAFGPCGCPWGPHRTSPTTFGAFAHASCPHVVGRVVLDFDSPRTAGGEIPFAIHWDQVLPAGIISPQKTPNQGSTKQHQQIYPTQNPRTHSNGRERTARGSRRRRTQSSGATRRRSMCWHIGGAPPRTSWSSWRNVPGTTWRATPPTRGG